MSHSALSDTSKKEGCDNGWWERGLAFCWVLLWMAEPGWEERLQGTIPTEGMRGGLDLLILPPPNPSWLRRPSSRPGPAPQFWGPASRLSGPLPEHGFQCCRDKDWDLCLSACSLQVPPLPVPLSEPVVPVFPGKLAERALWPSPALLSFYLLHPWGR